MFNIRRLSKRGPRGLRATRVSVESLEGRLLLSATPAARLRKTPVSSRPHVVAVNAVKTATVSADTAANTVAGMNYEYYQGTWTALPNFNNLTPIKGGLATDFSLTNRNSDSNFAFAFSGYINVPTTGTYTFYTDSIDGSSLSIDGTQVVNNDGLHGAQAASGTISLAAGEHVIAVDYFDQSGGSLLTVSYAGPGISQQVIPDAALSATAPATIDVSSYGAVGNGTTNDEPAIQAAINAAPDNTTLMLDAGKTYLLDSGLTIQKPLNIQANGATLLLDTSSYPQNETIYQQSPLSSSDTYTWKQTVSANQTTFAVAIPTADIEAGDYILLQLGQDPNDPNEPNYAAICEVTANTGSSITVDTPVPYAITQGNLSNEIQRITDLVQNDSITGLNLNFVSGTTPDTNIWLNDTRDMSISNITGNFTIMANISNSENVNISNVSGTLMQLSSSGGRAVTAYQSSGLSISNVSVTSVYDSPAVFLESWEHNTTITNLTMNWQYAGAPSTAVFFFTGSSYGTDVVSTTIKNAGYGEVDLVGSGAQSASYTFGTVDITGTVLAAPLTDISVFEANGQIDNAADALTTQPYTINIPKSANGIFYQLPGVDGILQSISVYISSLTGISSVTLYAGTNSGIDNHDAITLTGSLVAGQTVVLPQSYGTDYAINDPANPQKWLLFYTTSQVPTGATFKITAAYYPPQTGPAWLSASSLAVWNNSAHMLTVTGATSIIADPGTDEPIVQASGSAAVLTLDPTSGTDIHLGGLSLTDGASATVTSLGTARSTTNYHLLVIGVPGATAAPMYTIDSTSKLDLADNDMAILYGSGASPLSTMASELKQSYDGGLWDKPGLTSSIAKNSSGVTALGYGEASVLGVTTFDGLTLGGNAVLVKYTLAGDDNLDGTVNFNDFSILQNNYGQAGGWTAGDFNYDGTVNFNDFSILQNNEGKSLANYLG